MNESADDILDLTDIVDDQPTQKRGQKTFAAGSALDPTNLDQELDDLLTPSKSAATAKNSLNHEEDILDLTDELVMEEADEALVKTDLPVGKTADQPPTSASEPGVSHAEFEILNSRMDALEALVGNTALHPQQVLTALPKTLDKLPFVPALFEDLGKLITAKISDLASMGNLEELRTIVSTLQERLDAADSLAEASVKPLLVRLETLEKRPAPVLALRPEQILALLPETTESLPFSRALREELLDYVTAKIAHLAPTNVVQGLQQGMADVQKRLEAQASGQAELETLKNRLQQHDVAMLGLRAALEEKDAAITMLRDNVDQLRQDLAEMRQSLNTEDSQKALRDEVKALIKQEVPAAAATVIREEIQALLKDMDG